MQVVFSDSLQPCGSFSTFEFMDRSCTRDISSDSMETNRTGDSVSADMPFQLKGLRKRWAGRRSRSDSAGLDAESAGDFGLEPRVTISCDSAANTGLGSHIASHLTDAETGVQHDVPSQTVELGDGVNFSVGSATNYNPIALGVMDPSKREADWQSLARDAQAKRARQFYKLPWELEGSACRSNDLWSGTAVSVFDKMFVPTTIGAQDVFESQVIACRPTIDFEGREKPVVPLKLKHARSEPRDEDIRRQALMKLRDLVLQDPLSTQLGTILRDRHASGFMHDEIDQSFRDTFRAKASSTLQKRASSLCWLDKLLKEIGQLHPFRFTESQLYLVLCNMRSSGSGPTSAQHIVEALRFMDATAKFTLMDLSVVVSARCKGVARDLYLTKNPLQQKRPLSVDQVQRLERIMQSSNSFLQCIIGQILFCIHACCRWKDSQRLKSLYTESGHGETLLHADAVSSKTALTTEAKTRFLPYVAIGSGLLAEDWASTWLKARTEEGLEFGVGECVLPSFSERFSCWLDVPMSSSEATMWLREFLYEPGIGADKMIGSHSCKTTLLTWAGRSFKVVFSPGERKLLGHHLDPSMKSVLCYSRESYTSLYAKVLSMFRLIRSGDFAPDIPAIDRVVQLADHSEATSNEADKAEEVQDIDSDSDSSVASLESVGPVDDDKACSSRPCWSLFPDFPGVPESALMVHKVSGLIHVVSEDDTLLGGRPTSVHFKGYENVVDREHLASCRQCLRTFQCHRKDVVDFELT